MQTLGKGYSVQNREGGPDGPGAGEDRRWGMGRGAEIGTATEEVPISHPRCPHPHQCTDTCSTNALQGRQRFLKKGYEMHPP